MTTRDDIRAQLAYLTEGWAGTYDLDAAAADLEAQGITDPDSHSARDVVWLAVSAHEIVETTGEAMRREIPAALAAAPVGQPAVWESDLVRIEVTGHSRVNDARPTGQWTITAGGATETIEAPETWEVLVEAIDAAAGGASMTHTLALQAVRGAATRAGDLERRARAAKTKLDDEIRNALTRGVPVAKLAEHAGVSTARIYQIRDRRR